MGSKGVSFAEYDEFPLKEHVRNHNKHNDVWKKEQEP